MAVLGAIIGVVIVLGLREMVKCPRCLFVRPYPWFGAGNCAPCVSHVKRVEARRV